MSPTIEQKHLFPLSLVSSLISVMGCNQSKIENEEAVSRCKDRKQFMKSSVSARNAFAAAHPSYAISLKNAGAALSDYAQGEVLPTLSSAAAAVSVAAAVALPTQPPIGNLPPPPPVPDFNPPPLQRAASMPELPVSSKTITRADTIVEEQGEVEGEDEAEESEVGLRRWRSNKRGGGGDDAPPRPPSPPETPPSVTRVPPPPPEMNSTYDFFFNPEIPGGSLRDAEEISMEREEIERKVLEKRPKRSEDHVGGGGKHEEKVAVPENVVEELPPPPVQPPQGGVGAGGGKIVKKGKQVVGGGSGGSEGKRRNVSLVQVFNELDDCFLKASQSAHEVSKMLEAARLHYHSNFADNRGHIDHSARVMRVITWNRSFRGLQNAEEVKDDFDKEESETHATVLDKLLAWEKKLYDEVKAGEIMKFEYQRKVALLNKQKKRGTNSESLEKTKAAVSHLHTRYIVDMQSMDSTVSEINRLRDEQLYPKLVALVDAMARMWDAMQVHHEKQLRISTLLKDVDISQSASETTDYHHERTNQLMLVVQGWHAHFHNMVSHQKDYTRTLNSWLKLNLIPIESTLKEKVSSPPRPQTPPIQHLLLAWHDSLEKLPDEHAKSAIYNFEAVLTSIYQLQQEEMKLKAKLEESRREHQRKQRSFTDWYRKYREQQITGSGENDPEFGRDEDGLYRDEAVVEREFVVETAKRKVEEDEENYQRHCIHVREKSLVSLKTRLPELFGAISKFAMASSEMYRSLSAVALSQDQKQKESSS